MKKIILASKSPRRIEMLSKYIEDIKIIIPEIDEIISNDDTPQVNVMRLAFQKACRAAEISTGKSLIISADTVVYLDEILGKPKSYDDGFQMLKHLSAKKHRVYTGVCLIDTVSNKKIVDYEMTEVQFNELSDEEIIRYLDTGEYKDKAGSYGIQGYGEIFVKSINGCYNNVKGLPISRINFMLKEYFNQSFL